MILVHATMPVENLETMVFGGQGAGLNGGPIIDPVLRNHYAVQRVLEVASEEAKTDLESLSFGGSVKQQLQNQQVLIYANHMTTYLLVVGRLKVDENETIDLGYYNPPKNLTGFSIGMYGAFTAGGAWDFRTGMKMVKKRQDIMDKDDRGIMTSVVGKMIDPEYLGDVCLNEAVEVAIYKCPGNYSIGGLEGDVKRVVQKIYDDGKLKLESRTDVKGAIHTFLFKSEAEEFRRELISGNYIITEPGIPVIGTDAKTKTFYVTDRTLIDGYAVGEIVDFLDSHLHTSCYFDSTIKKLNSKHYTVLGKGADAVAGFIKRVMKGVTTGVVDLFKKKEKD